MFKLHPSTNQIMDIAIMPDGMFSQNNE